MESATTLDLFSKDGQAAAAALQRSTVAFVLLDRKTWLIKASNKAFKELCQKETIIGRRFLDLIHANDRNLLINCLDSISDRSELSELVEVRISCGTPDHWQWIMTTITELSDSSSAPGLMLLHVVDTDRQKTQETIEAAKARRWNYALVRSGLGVWDHNYGTGEQYYSKTWRIMRGLPAEQEPPPQSTEEWLAKLHPEDRDFVRHAIERQRAGDPDFMNFEYREQHVDGHWIWIECRGDAVEFFEDGKPSRIVGTDRDISDRKLSERMLARTRRRLEMALETSQIGVFERNLATDEVVIDARVAEIYGMGNTAGTIPFSRFIPLVHPDDVQRIRKRASGLVLDGPSITDRFRIYRENDGELRHIQHRVAIFKSDQGTDTYIGTSWDVTEEMRMRLDLVTAKQVAEARNFELDKAKSEIDRAIHHDYLTGLPNRRFLDEELSRRLEIARNDESGVALLQFDIDNFRSYNATYGHEAGDALLKHVASLLLNMSRHNDFVARISGDEFVLVTSFDSSRKSLLHTAERILMELSKPFEANGKRLRATTSIGISTNRDPHSERISAVLQNAGAALKQAKSEGPNRIALFKPERGRSQTTKPIQPEELIEAIEEGAFIPYYQPQFDARTRQLYGLEALARWTKNNGEIIEPGRFMPLADSLNLMNQIDKAILEKALSDSAQWQAKGFDIPRLSVNLSPRRLSDPALVPSLQKLDIANRQLSFELLESIFLDRQDDISAYNLREIRKLGIEIEIDDFGTGYTSITSLLHVAPQALKIARELVMPLTHSREQRTIIKSIIDIGKALKIRVVAEGVETEEQIQLLTSLGCDVLQGYALGRPMPREHVESILKTEEQAC